VRRGYNQALEMARPIAAALSVPLVGSALVRHGQQMQRGLNREQRQRNVAQSFTADACVRGQRVLVIDDVTTTGASLLEAARALRAAGATQVIAWAAAAVD
jgi:predicted amidophosphoribosyltransferase